jgi:large repetitive protein
LQIYKEKEMNFRRLITAFALLALFVGLASAQVNVGGIGGPAGALSCTASVAAPPQLRSEGITELIGDIVLTCTGGPIPTASTPTVPSPIPTANFTVSLGTNVTSRILSTSAGVNASEALLLVDEPGSALTPVVPGFGPAAPQANCSSPTGGATPAGCGTQYVQFAAGTATIGGSYAVASSSSTATTTAPNIFQGIVNGNQVVFNGIPILAPSTVGVARVFRITNIRANASGLGSGGLPGTTQVLASVAISGSTALPVNNPVLIAGFIQKGLSTSVLSSTSTGSGVSTTPFQQCAAATRSAVATLAFTENFATAFKVRGGIPQNVPGTIYNTESGFIDTGVTSTGGLNGNAIAGLADFGTRLKAVFNNLPSGVRIFVSTTNLTAAANSAPGTNAVLVVSETAPDAGNGATYNSGYTVPTLPATSTVSGSATINVAELPVVGNSATAVWEVVGTNPSLSESLYFGVYITYAASPATGSPTAPATATVNMSFAPTSTVTTADMTSPIPRFVDTSSAATLFSTTICQTVLLYPFVTNQAGFDTGLAIANTSTDPFGTAAQAGTCTLNFYGNTAPSAAVPVASVASGTVYTTLASVAAPGFQGYMIAVCNFQMAHGFAFISDLGARNLAMGYLAEIIPSGTAKRPVAGTLSDATGLAF